MIDSPEALLQVMRGIVYVGFVTLMAPEDVLATGMGSCHDQAILEYTELNRMGFNPTAKFIMSVDEDGQGEETHSFVYYSIGNRWYWFENAWSDLAGIREYSSEAELIGSVMFAFGRRNGFDRLYLADLFPSEHTTGETLSDFVDICMNHAEEYVIE